MSSFKPIDFFIHPLPLAAALLTGVNDHWLKYQYPGFVTGKLSDFCGLFYFPLFLSALFVLGVRLFKKDFSFNSGLLIVAIIVTDTIFCILKLNPAIRDSFVHFFSQNIFTIAVAHDATDLIALTASFACYMFGRKFFEKPIVE